MSTALMRHEAPSRFAAVVVRHDAGRGGQAASADCLLDDRVQVVWSQVVLRRLPREPGSERVRLPGHCLLYVVAGEAACETDHGRQVVAAGDLLLLPPGTPHRLSSRRAGREARAYCFELRLARGGQELRLAERPWQMRGERALHAQVAGLHDELAAGGARGRGRARALLYLVLTADEAAVADADDAPQTLNRAQRQALIAFVDRGPDGSPSVARLAAQVGLSVDYFSRLFRVSFGMPPRQWLVETRVRRAAERLRHDDRPIAELARAFGYRSERLFGRQFKAVMGLTPSAYRRAHGRVPAW